MTTSMKAVVGRSTQVNVKVDNRGGALQSGSPITIKNQITEIRSIEDISDVAEIDVTNGATLVYNSATDKYEVKKLELGNFAGILDGGTF